MSDRAKYWRGLIAAWEQRADTGQVLSGSGREGRFLRVVESEAWRNERSHSQALCLAFIPYALSANDLRFDAFGASAIVSKPLSRLLETVKCNCFAFCFCSSVDVCANASIEDRREGAQVGGGAPSSRICGVLTNAAKEQVCYE